MGHTARILVFGALLGCSAEQRGTDHATDAAADASADGGQLGTPPLPLDATWTLGEGTRSGVVSCWCPCSDGEGTSARECRGAEQETLDTFGDAWASSAERSKGADAGVRCWCRCLDVPLEVLPATPNAYAACSADAGP